MLQRTRLPAAPTSFVVGLNTYARRPFFESPDDRDAAALPAAEAICLALYLAKRAERMRNEMQHPSLNITRAIALESAWNRALHYYPALKSMAGSANSIREAMEVAIIKAQADGQTDIDCLVDAALDCLPNTLHRPQS